MVTVATITIQPWALVCDDCSTVVAVATIATQHKPTARAKCSSCGGRAHWFPNGHVLAHTGLEPVDLAGAYGLVHRQ